MSSSHRPPIAVILYNRRAVFVPPYPKDLIDEKLRFRPAGYYFSPKFKLGVWDGWLRYLRRDSCPAGTFLDYLKEWQAADLAFDIEDLREVPYFYPPEHKPYQRILQRAAEAGKPIRRYQHEIVEAMVAASGTGGIVLAATGSGKTVTAGLFFARLNGTATFVVDELTLLDQARNTFHTLLGEEIGIVGASLFQPARITVATIQTLHKHRDRKDVKRWFDAQDVVVLDELHVQLAHRNIDLLEKRCPKAIFGLTATLEYDKPEIRLRATSLAGPLIYRYSLEKGTRQQFLTPGLVCAVAYRNASIRGASAKTEYLARIVVNRARNNVVEGLAREAISRGLPTVILAERISHLNVLAKRFKDIRYQIICGRHSRAERQQAKADFDAGKIQLLITNRVFSKGVDIARIAVIIDATASRSANSAGQRFGRGTRLSETKEGLLYFDVFDITPANERGKNHWHKASEDRRSAYKALGIAFTRRLWRHDASEIVSQALHDLALVVDRYRRQSLL